MDALDALLPHLDAVVLIGAQAVYEHTLAVQLPVAMMTTDADVALDGDVLAGQPDIAALMSAAGFSIPNQPGHWTDARDIAVDLMVAPHQSGTTNPTARGTGLPQFVGSVPVAVAHHIRPGQAALPLEMGVFSGQQPPDWGAVFALLFLAFQRFFVESVASSGVKG